MVLKKIEMIGIVLFLSIFLFSTISAYCNEGQTILNLSSAMNAHGMVYNGLGNYKTQICYNEIFGVTYDGASPHTCSGTNKVIGLSSLTNAHAQIPSETDYAVDVCYGDLECGSYPKQMSDSYQFAKFSERYGYSSFNSLCPCDTNPLTIDCTDPFSTFGGGGLTYCDDTSFDGTQESQNKEGECQTLHSEQEYFVHYARSDTYLFRQFQPADSTINFQTK